MHARAWPQPPLKPPQCQRSLRLAVVARASHNDEKSLFVFGLGYTGLAAANYFQHRKWHVAGTCRSNEKTESLRTRGFNAFTFNADGYEQLNRPALAALERATHVLCTVPPNGDSDPVLMAHSRELINYGEPLQWVGYLSSTSVYGDHGSGWVDEDSELLAAHGKGLSRILAEGSWVALCYEYGVPVHVFRCGGIYGPRRSALDAVQKEGAPSASQLRRGRQKYTARCHVADICQVLEASAAKPRAGGIYNVVDDEPASRGEVIDFASRLLAAKMAAVVHELPPSQPTLPAAARKENTEKNARNIESVMSMDDGYVSGLGPGFTSDSSLEEIELRQLVGRLPPPSSHRPPSPFANGGETRAEEREHMLGVAATPNGEKRVKNSLIKTELGVELLFPTYKEGLKAISDGDLRPFD